MNIENKIYRKKVIKEVMRILKRHWTVDTSFPFSFFFDNDILHIRNVYDISKHYLKIREDGRYNLYGSLYIIPEHYKIYNLLSSLKK